MEPSTFSSAGQRATNPAGDAGTKRLQIAAGNLHNEYIQRVQQHAHNVHKCFPYLNIMEGGNRMYN